MHKWSISGAGAATAGTAGENREIRKTGSVGLVVLIYIYISKTKYYQRHFLRRQRNTTSIIDEHIRFN